MRFEIKTDLPIEDQVEIDRIQAISSGLRSTGEAAFLTARLPYLTNEILESDNDGLILKARGNTLPTSYSGFAKGAQFIKADASTKAVYENVGDSTTATWDLVSSAETADIADDSVTYAKIQNVSATDKVLGRSSSGAGNVEEIPCTTAGRALLAGANVAAQRSTLELGAMATKANVVLADLAAGIAPSHVVKFAGISASEEDADSSVVITVTGALATDIASVVLRAAANAVYVTKAVLTENTLTVTLSGNGGAGTQVDYVIYRAAA